MSRATIIRWAGYVLAVACAALHFAGCASPAPAYVKCQGRGSIQGGPYAIAVDCPPPGLELSIGATDPTLLAPAK